MATDTSIMKDINLSGPSFEEIFPEYIDNQSLSISINLTWELLRNLKAQTLI